MNVVDLLHGQGAARPDQPAIVEPRGGRDRAITFGGFERASARAAALMHRKGLRPGDAVLVLQTMSVDLYVALAAILRLGLVAEFVDPSFTLGTIERCCAAWPPVALIGGTKAHLLRFVVPALRRIPLTFCTGARIPGAVPWSELTQQSIDALDFSCPAEAPALVTFTSGSTGEPKVLARSHGLLMEQLRVLERVLQPKPGETSLTTLPMVVLANLGLGATSLLPPAELRRPCAVGAARIVAQVRRGRPSTIVAAPALLERVARECLRDGSTLESVQRVFVGGGPVFPRLCAETQAVAPAAEIVTVYGSSEAEPIAALPYSEVGRDELEAIRRGRGLPVGRPVDGMQVRILHDQWGGPLEPLTSEEFAAHCLPPDEAGEIVVNGPHVVRGYVGGVGDQGTKLRVGSDVWHRTGDAGWLDGQGRLWLLGRCAARIADSKRTLYPFAVECAAVEDPAVRRAAFFSSEGRRLLALETYRAGVKPDLTSVRRAVEWAEVDAIQVVDRIPVDPRHNSKVDYPRLRAEARRRFNLARPERARSG